MFPVQVYIIMFLVLVYIYVVCTGVCMCLMFAFCIKFVDFKILCLSCYFAKQKLGGPFSGQPDIPEDCQISQLGSPVDCQIFWSYVYP